MFELLNSELSKKTYIYWKMVKKENVFNEN